MRTNKFSHRVPIVGLKEVMDVAEAEFQEKLRNPETGRYSCMLCRFACGTIEEFEYHMDNVYQPNHYRIPTYICDACNVDIGPYYHDDHYRSEEHKRNVAGKSWSIREHYGSLVRYLKYDEYTKSFSAGNMQVYDDKDAATSASEPTSVTAPVPDEAMVV